MFVVEGPGQDIHLMMDSFLPLLSEEAEPNTTPLHACMQERDLLTDATLV